MELGAIERKDLSTAIAERLKELIVAGRFRPGERLPSERELARVLKVTRTTLREALKILETLRFVAIRQGDGVRVRDFLRVANIEVLADLLFRNGRLDPSILANILEARRIMGEAIASLAAKRASQAQVEEYRARVQRLKDLADAPSQFQEADLDCFDALAEAAGNLVFVFVLNSIRPVYLARREVFEPLYREPKAIVEGHERLLSALESGDEEGARSAAAELLTVPGDMDGISEEEGP